MSDKKKILLLTRPICPPWDDALKNFPYDIARNIQNDEIILLTCKNLPGLTENVIQKNVYSSPRWDLTQKIKSYKFLFKSLFWENAKDFDILHSFFTPTKLNIFALKLLIRNKNLKIIQTITTLREDLHSKDDFKKILFGDMIITYSDYAKEKLEQLGFGNVKRIYPGIDLQKYSPAPKKIILMDKYGIKSDDFVINFTGEYTRLGAIEDVAESFIDLVKERKNFHLQLACRIKNEADAKKKEEIAARFKDAGCLEKVSFLDDQRYEMCDIYNLCDISIFPVRDMDGKFDIPLAVIEAMACQKPVIASSLERLRYFLNDDNSILIKPGNREALKEKILYLYNNPDRCRELGEKGMQFARDNFDILKVVKEYEGVYALVTNDQ